MAHPIRRAAVVGAGSFGTAVAVVLERGGVRTTLFTRTAEQARELESSRRNQHYLDTVELPGGLRIRALDSEDACARRGRAVPVGARRADPRRTRLLLEGARPARRRRAD